LQGAKEKSKAASCLNNLKQIGLAVSMYAGDWEDTYPPWVEGTYVWGQFVGDYEINGTPGTHAGFGAKIYPYLGRKGQWRVFVCPSDKIKRDLTDTTSNSGQGTGASYGMSASGSGPWGLSFMHIGGGLDSGGNPPRWVKQSQVQWPSEKGLVADARATQTSGWSDPFPYGLLYHSWNAWLTYYPRHTEGVNVLFCDGHTAWVKVSQFFPSTGPSSASDPLYRFWAIQ
jgi:prepilin-type processing-associated H-X9-DG protein